MEGCRAQRNITHQATRHTAVASAHLNAAAATRAVTVVHQPHAHVSYATPDNNLAQRISILNTAARLLLQSPAHPRSLQTQIIELIRNRV